jgi:competence ComEA-like helix-hairpin-helix protein
LKQYLPHNILLALAIVSIGLILLINTVFRRSYATTLMYAAPAIEQETVQQTEPPSQPTTSPPTEAPATEATEPETQAEPEPEIIETLPTEAETAPIAVQFPLDINAATMEEILLIPGVGNSMAQKIVQYRDYLGGAYSELEQLKNISGVGEQTYVKLWQHFTIEGEVYEAGDELAEPEWID